MTAMGHFSIVGALAQTAMRFRVARHNPFPTDYHALDTAMLARTAGRHDPRAKRREHWEEAWQFYRAGP
jgi:hypothetical protein